MTYNVFGGTLSLTQSINQSLIVRRLYAAVNHRRPSFFVAAVHVCNGRLHHHCLSSAVFSRSTSAILDCTTLVVPPLSDTIIVFVTYLPLILAWKRPILVGVRTE